MAFHMIGKRSCASLWSPITLHVKQIIGSQSPVRQYETIIKMFLMLTGFLRALGLVLYLMIVPEQQLGALGVVIKKFSNLESTHFVGC
jgi:hypothetical protein